jgi:hypothetical protein
MEMTEKYLFELISKGESETVEFKTRFSNERIIATVLTSFANSNGGYLFVGIGDKGEILGLSDQECLQMRHRLNNICNSLFSFPFQVGIVSLSGRNIVYAHIEKAPNHLSPISIGDGKIFIRKGGSNIKVRQKTKMFSVGANKVVPKQEIVGFIAMSFRNEEEPALIDYYHSMLRAVKKTNLPIKLNRIDLQEGDYEISQQIMNEIEKSDFVIADFTLSPHNVYFEIGFARGLKKRIIQTTRKDTVLQFDVRNWTTLFYRNATELEEKLDSKLKDVYKGLTK